MDGVKQDFLLAYDTLADAIYRFCYYRVFSKEVAEELTQETFMKTWLYLSQNQRIDNLKAFLYRVATNLVIDYARKSKTESLESLQEKGFDAAIRENNEDWVTVREIIGNFKQLPTEFHEVLTLRYIDDLSPKEIAEVLEITANLVSVRINRGLELLRNILHIKK
jgi:RNA polymerase sigma-70 factor (ECF subfamily)